MTEAIKDMTPRPSKASGAAGPTISAGFARGLVDFAVTKGAARDALVARSGIAPDVLADPDNRVPVADYIALVRAGAELCREPALALQFGEAVDMADLSIVGLICHAADNPADAFVQLNRYARLAIDVETEGAGDRLQIVERNGDRWLVDTRKDPNRYPEITEQVFARMAGAAARPGDAAPRFVKAVHFTHPEPAYRAEYDRIFRAPIVFGSQWNAMRIDAAWAASTMGRSSPYTVRLLSERADALLQALETSKTVRGQVERLLIPLLHRGDSTIGTIARRMGVSRQTLYRKLKAEGVSFEQVLDELRHALGQHYLDEERLSLAEIAYLLGFSEPSAFSRAFKRWTGRSPRQRAR